MVSQWVSTHYTKTCGNKSILFRNRSSVSDSNRCDYLEIVESKILSFLTYYYDRMPLVLDQVLFSYKYPISGGHVDNSSHTELLFLGKYMLQD